MITPSNKMEPLVSIILPNYNYSKFLPERITSILNQNFQDFELIVLDDASTDNSVQLLDELAKNPKVSNYVINVSNTGTPFAQWKKGVELARGKYIWIAEADDSSTPAFLEKCVGVMETDPNVVLCYAGCNVVNEKGELLNRDYTMWKGKKMEGRLGKTITHNGSDFIIHNMYWGCYVYNASATLFRKSAVTPDMFDQSLQMKNSGDWLFWTKLIGRGKVAEIYEKLNIFRLHGANVTERGYNSGNLYREDIDVIKYIEDHYHVGKYRKLLRHGTYIKKLMRSNLPDALKKQLLSLFYDKTGATMNEYRLERIHKVLWNIFPGLMSMKSDRL